MRLRLTGQAEKWRVAVFIAVLSLHLLAGLALFATGTIRVARLRAVETPVALLWLSPRRPPQLPAASSTTPQHNVKRREASPDIDRTADVARPEPEPSNAITLPLDLSTDADSVARRQADKERNERRWRNLAGPSDSQLEWWRNNTPLIRDYHQFGDEEHAEGGELITWANDKCYYTTHGLTTFGMPQTGMVCKDPPKPETDLFKDMRKKLDEGAKGRAP
jgi:hypothetical protein